MAIKTFSVAPFGLESLIITVEVSMMSAVPAFQIVGLPDKAVNEAKERVKAALLSCGISLPAKKILINLAPADIPKEGGRYDLPIALALLASLGVVPSDKINNLVSLGELRLDGTIETGFGILPAALAAHRKNYSFLCGSDSLHELCDVNITSPIVASDLLNVINIFNDKALVPSLNFQNYKKQYVATQKIYDLADIHGQETAKHALEIAAAGGHNLLFSGPPGVGKSMLASCFPDILPPPSVDEMFDMALIASVSGTYSGVNLQKRPFRSPHHSASMAALIGGGRKAMPGDITLAHAGVLFLDELPEFKTDVLDSLRQPLETGEVVISRAERRITYPSRFQLIAAMNPCKCGYLGEDGRECHKAPSCGSYYTNKISGPLLDRFDIKLHLPSIKLHELAAPSIGEKSEIVRQRVVNAYERQQKRAKIFKGMNGVSVNNACAKGEFFKHICQLTDKAQNLVNKAIDKLNLSARGYHRILRTARTIQDLEDIKQGNVALDNKIDVHNLAIAINFRH